MGIRAGKVKQVILPSTVKRIGDNAFDNCAALESINLPEGLTYLGAYAFQYCTSLTEISFPSTLKEIGNSAFRNCSRLESATFSEGLVEICGSAFSGCRNLLSVELPESLKFIRDHAFSFCGLEEVRLGENLREINSGAFKDCSYLKTITYNGTEEQWNDIRKCTEDTWFVRPWDQGTDNYELVFLK
jgi:hypothetical protein